MKVLATTLLSLSFYAASFSFSSLVPSILKLTSATQPGHCTVFSINSSKGYWQTASHCEMPDMMIGDQPAKIVKIDYNTDLMLLQSETKRPALRLSKKAPQFKQDVITAGFPMWATRIMFFFGKVQAVSAKVHPEQTRNMLVLHEGGGPGMSGCPIMNSKGEVISVLQLGAQIPSVVIWGADYKDLKEFTKGYWGK